MFINYIATSLSTTTTRGSILLALWIASRFGAQAFVVPSSLDPTTRSSLASFSSLSGNNNNNNDHDDSSSFVVGILGDLHMDPRHLQDYQDGREHFQRIFDESTTSKNAAAATLVSLGDLGESKAVWPDSDELFAGTTPCHEMAAAYLKSFGVPYEVVGGNHGECDKIKRENIGETHLRDGGWDHSFCRVLTPCCNILSLRIKTHRLGRY